MNNYLDKKKGKLLTNREQIGEVLFCIAFAFHFAACMTGHVNTTMILIWKAAIVRKYLRLGAQILLAVKFFCFQKTDWPRRLIALALCLLGYITFEVSGSKWFYWTPIFLAAAKDVDVKKVAKTALLVMVPGFIATVACAQLGIIDTLVATRATTGAARNSMGFVHYNTCGLYVFEICLAVCAVRFGKRPTWEILLAGVGAVFCWVVPNSRTYALAIVILAVFACICYYVRSKAAQRFLTVCMAGGTLFLVTFSYFCMLFYTDTNPILAKLDSIFTTRLSLAHHFYTTYGLTLLGRSYADAPIIHDNVRFLVDNSYCDVPLYYGVIAGAVFLVMIAVFYADAIKNRRWDLCLLGFTMFMIVGFSECMAFRINTNYFLIAVAGIFYGTRKGSRGQADRPVQRD